ncbi:hypothetical protein ACYSNR_16685 [Enterococcus sp. LJL128]
MIILRDYTKKVIRVGLLLGIFSGGSLAVIMGLVLVFGQTQESETSFGELILVSFILSLFVFLLVSSFQLIPLLFTYYQLRKYLEDGTKEKQEELLELLNGEMNQPAIWLEELYFTRHYLLSLPSFILDKDELVSHKFDWKGRNVRHGRIYKAVFILKNKKKVLRLRRRTDLSKVSKWRQGKIPE